MKVSHMWWAWGLFGLLVGVSVWELVGDHILEPSPYHNVELLQDETRDGWRYITVNFIKTDCERKAVAFVGESLGLSDQLLFEDLNGNTASQDRTQGRQTLLGRIFVGETPYEKIEIRTIHDCDGHRVARTFLALE